MGYKCTWKVFKFSWLSLVLVIFNNTYVNVLQGMEIYIPRTHSRLSPNPPTRNTLSESTNGSEELDTKSLNTVPPSKDNMEAEKEGARVEVPVSQAEASEDHGREDQTPCTTEILDSNLRAASTELLETSHDPNGLDSEDECQNTSHLPSDTPSVSNEEGDEMCASTNEAKKPEVCYIISDAHTI